MTALLLLAAIVIFACVLGNRVSQRFGVPTLLAFILLGMLFGTDGLLRIDFDNYQIAEDVCFRCSDWHYVLRRLRHQLAGGSANRGAGFSALVSRCCADLSVNRSVFAGMSCIFLCWKEC